MGDVDWGKPGGIGDWANSWELVVSRVPTRMIGGREYGGGSE